MGKIKILHVGDFRFDFYDESLFQAFKENPKVCESKFEWASYFSNYQYNNLKTMIFNTVSNRYKFGSKIKGLNDDLVAFVKENEFDIIFVWRGIHLYPQTIRELSKVANIIGYNNDKTFSKNHPWWLFRLLKKSIPYYDHFFVYRPQDIKAIEELGTKTSVFMPTFDAGRIYPIENREQHFDVAFIGHFEDDGRDKLILEMIESGFKVLLKGQRWSESNYYSKLTDKLGEICPAYDDYNECLNSAKVCLSFLSKLNDDSYTRRTLEIPATKTTMLAEYTSAQADMFKPDVEAVYFTSHEDAMQKLSYLIANPSERENIALSGYEKVKSGPYQLADRVNEIIEVAVSNYNDKQK